MVTTAADINFQRGRHVSGTVPDSRVAGPAHHKSAIASRVAQAVDHRVKRNWETIVHFSPVKFILFWNRAYCLHNGVDRFQRKPLMSLYYDFQYIQTNSSFTVNSCHSRLSTIAAQHLHPNPHTREAIGNVPRTAYSHVFPVSPGDKSCHRNRLVSSSKL